MNIISTDLPDNYSRLVRAASMKDMFHIMATARLDVNVILWRRGGLSGAFNDLAQELMVRSEAKSLYARMAPSQMRGLDGLSGDISVAHKSLVDDLKMFSEYGQKSVIRVLGDEGYGENIVSNFHSDGGEWRLLACYNDPATKWVRNEDAVPVGQTHYEPVPGATVYSMQPGDVWVQRGREKKEALPFIHKGEAADAGKYRMMVAGMFMRSS